MATRPIPPSPITRTVRENEPTSTWATVSESVASGRDEIVMESAGLPAVAVISLEEYRHLLEIRKEEKRVAALRWLKEFQQSYDGRNDDLSEDELMGLAVRATREIRTELAEATSRRGESRASSSEHTPE